MKLSPTGVLVGVGVALVTPIVLPAVAAVARPLAKGAIRGYLSISDKMKELTAEAGEQWSDLVAEARSEQTVGAEAMEAAEASS